MSSACTRSADPKTTMRRFDMRAEEIKALYGAQITALQHALHRIPELSLREYKTTAVIKETMGAQGFELLDVGTQTGAAFRLRTGKPGAAICLRADVDGIEAQEAADRPVRSAHPGWMHACGHDVHSAGLYGAALALNALRYSLQQDVIFLFQSAEEYAVGAQAVIESGFFDRENVAAVYGLHNMPSMTVGTVAIAAGPVMAAKDSFRIRICGRGGHGAMPEQCADPIVAAASLITMLQTVVSRSISPLDSAAITVSAIHSGSTDNRVEDEVQLLGSVRSLQPETRTQIQKRMETIVLHCAAAHGCTGCLEFTGGVPAVVNAPSLLPGIQAAAERALGRENVTQARPVMISEDFSHYCRIRPAFFCFLGSGGVGRENAPLHSGSYLAHEDTAFHAAALLTEAALQHGGSYIY